MFVFVIDMAKLILGIAAIAVLSAAPVYLGWNFGVLQAFPKANLGEVNPLGAYCIALLVHVIANSFQNALVLNKK